MKKFNKAKLLSILVMIFILTSFMPTVCKAEEKIEDTNLITMNINYGIEGKFKGMTSIPVNIELESNGEEIEGEVEVRVPTNTINTYDAFVVKVKLASKEKRTVTIPINLPENCSKISVLFTQGENILKENNVIVSSGRVNESDMFMGVLTDDFNGLTIRYLDFTDLNKNKGEQINKIVSVPLNIDFLSKNSKNISSLDVIVLNNYNISNLKKEQYENLSTWINNGGILIIGSGENASKTIANINKEFLDINYNGTKDINGYTLADLSLKDESVILQERENPLIHLIKKGRGKVYISTFDLANKNIASKDNVMNTLKECLQNDFMSKNNIYNRNGGYVSYEMEKLSTNVPMKEDFKMGVLVAIFIVYALVVGIIIYLVMKKLNKREWLWGIIPVIAITFSILLYLLGSTTRIQDLVLNQINIIVTDKSGTSESRGYVGIGSKYKDDLIVREPIGSSIQKYDNDNYYYDDNVDANNLTKLGTKAVYGENNSYYEFKDLAALKMKKFEISGHKEIVPSIEAQLNYNSQKLVGKIKNTLGYDIEKLLIVSSNDVWDIGEIKANEEKPIEVNTYSTYGLIQYGESLRENYYDNYKFSNDKKENKWAFKDILRISSLMRCIGETNLSNKSTYLLAITDMPVDYGFDFGKKSVSKYDTTAIIQDLDIDFIDIDGNLNYPLGYFKGKIVKSDSNIDIETRHNEINGSGELVLDYLVDEEINLLDLKVGYRGNQNSSTFKGTMYIYNYEKNNYDKINYTANGESLKNPNQYIKDGKVTVKLNCKDEDCIGIPQIAVKGRVK